MTKTSSKMNSGNRYFGLRRMSQDHCSFGQHEQVVLKYGARVMSKENSDFGPFKSSRIAKLALVFWRSDA